MVNASMNAAPTLGGNRAGFLPAEELARLNSIAGHVGTLASVADTNESPIWAEVTTEHPDLDLRLPTTRNSGLWQRTLRWATAAATPFPSVIQKPREVEVPPEGYRTTDRSSFQDRAPMDDDAMERVLAGLRAL